MEEPTKLLLTSILDALLARVQSGRFSVSWEYSPQSGLGLTGRDEDGTQLFAFRVTSQTLNELRSRLSAEATDEERH
jgi:hypothetical protein